jgi:hypothetical protein
MKSSIKQSTALVTSLCLISACADHSRNIPAQYVSPVQYDGYSCKQIAAEMSTVSGRVSDLAAQNDKAASNDEVAMGVGLILFWPALFFLDSNTAQAAEYGRLKGEFDALEKAGIRKNCGLHVERPRTPAPATNESKAPDYPTPRK